MSENSSTISKLIIGKKLFRYKTYIEKCYRNKINLTDALIRLMEDNPIQ